MNDRAQHSLKSDARRDFFLQLDPQRKRRAENAKCSLCAAWRSSMGSRRWRDEEFPHVEGIGTVGVKQVRRSDISFSDDSGDAGQREL